MNPGCIWKLESASANPTLVQRAVPSLVLTKFPCIAPLADTMPRPPPATSVSLARRILRLFQDTPAVSGWPSPQRVITGFLTESCPAGSQDVGGGRNNRTPGGGGCGGANRSKT